MREMYKYPIWRLFLPLLFVGYLGVTIYYTHIHIENYTVYVHTHPYEKDEPVEHSHNNENMVALDLMAHTPFSENVVFAYDFTAMQPLQIHNWQTKPTRHSQADCYQNASLRAPPSSCVLAI